MMTRDEVKEIVMVIYSTYPNWKPDDLKFTVNAWYLMLSDYDYKQISLALKAYITTDISGFAPSVGQVIGKLQMLSMPDELNEMEAWALVSNALRNGYYGADDEFNKLPPLVQKAVGTASQLRHWSQTDIESVENVVQSNFMRTYRTVVRREKELMRLPEEIKAMRISENSNSIENHQYLTHRPKSTKNP